MGSHRHQRRNPSNWVFNWTVRLQRNALIFSFVSFNFFFFNQILVFKVFTAIMQYDFSIILFLKPYYV